MRNSKLTRRLVLLILTLLIAGSCVMQDRHHMVDADRFLQLADEPMSSMHSTSFIGTVHDRAFLHRWSKTLWGHNNEVYSCPLDSLPRDLAERLEAGENPWAR